MLGKDLPNRGLVSPIQIPWYKRLFFEMRGHVFGIYLLPLYAKAILSVIAMLHENSRGGLPPGHVNAPAPEVWFGE